jgi:hypothetical protein
MLQARPLPGMLGSLPARPAGSGENALPTQLAAGMRYVEELWRMHCRAARYRQRDARVRIGQTRRRRRRRRRRREE